MKTKVWLVGLATMALGSPTAIAAGAEPRTVALTVTENGFEPARVNVAQDEPLKLVVERTMDATCAKEIVIPDENIKAALPLNTPVTIMFTPKDGGDITYACGMNMISGVLHVASRERESAEDGDMAGGHGGMMGGMEDMSAIHGLLSQHKKIKRSVKDIPDGVETVTTSDDAQVANLIREHVRQMKSRIEEGRPIRQMDPLFRELFKNYQHIHMDIADIPGGVRVTETADTPEVVSLVRQHARRAVSEFVAEGMRRAMQPTPLPPGYVPTEDQHHPQGGRSHACRCMGST